MAVQKVGFLPCFAKYLFKQFPLENIYQVSAYKDKVKHLLSSLIEVDNPTRLTTDHGVGKEIQPIRPDSGESKRLIKLCDYDGQIYRIDYGDNPFRVLFGISNSNRLVHILAIDTSHSTFNGKHK